MRIEVFFTPTGVPEHSLRDRTVVIIDVLRSSTSIISALQNGAKEVIPVAEVEDALKISANLVKGQSLLCGEREGKLIEGFDLGNSPESFKPEVVTGKSLICCTTNGTGAMMLAKNAKTKDLLIASFTNISIVKEFILKPENIENHLTILCAGKNHMFSLEDVICAGLLIDRLQTDKMNKIAFQLSDTAASAKILYEQYRGNELAALKGCEHGKYLISLGFESDVEFCAKIDSSQALPVLQDSVFKLSKIETKKFKRVS